MTSLLSTVREHCRECGIEHPLTQSGHIVEHNRSSWGTNQRCRGSVKRSAEFRDAKKARKLAGQLEHEDAWKLDAAVALDGLASDPRPPFKYEELLKLAVNKHKRLFGPGQPQLEVVRTHVQRSGGKWAMRNPAYYMDVYCRFCGGLLRARLPTASDPESLPKVREHTLRCALECLAGMREMQGPGINTLIDEDRAFES